jgi:glycine/D-amino acid oxidase-like deaminating enzyme
MTAAQIRIGVVGGGIGGLTLALALRRRGLEADVYEQASELREIGAAVAVSANATHERATNAALHLPDDATAGRAARLAKFPERFGWIHEFDALGDVRACADRRPIPIDVRRRPDAGLTQKER